MRGRCPRIGDTAVERGKNTLRPLRAVRYTTAVSRQGLPPHSTTLARVAAAHEVLKANGRFVIHSNRMNLFKPKPKPAPLTLKERVAEFWKWFSANAERFYATIEDKKCAELQPETTEAMKKWMGDMSWVYGPGENKTGHSLTLTGEGFLPKQFVAEYWASRAPKLKGWTFYSSRQPSEADGWGFKIHLRDSNEDFKPIEFWVIPLCE
jgi:hypothetical protein